jgi:hypothetical protein
MLKRYEAAAAAGTGGGPWLDEAKDGELVKAEDLSKAIGLASEKVAEAILEEWSVGGSSTFCDEVDWDSAEQAEVAKLIADTLKRALSV